jgi:hypothetical protein
MGAAFDFEFAAETGRSENLFLSQGRGPYISFQTPKWTHFIQLAQRGCAPREPRANSVKSMLR